MAKLCALGKKIKHNLVDIEQSKDWLISKVHADTGLTFDFGYLWKIMAGKLKTPRIIAGIRKILEIPAPKE